MGAPLVVAVLLGLATSAAQATEPAKATPLPPAAAQASPAAAGEPQVKQTVLEDDGVRIEETRVRGQVTRVVVRSKQADVRPYELIIGNAARDPSQRGQASGQRVWHILSF